MVLAGESGCGKTHLAKSIYNFCFKCATSAFDTGHWGKSEVPSVHFSSWPEVAGLLSEKNNNHDNYNYVQDAFNYSLLVLDDIGAENDPWAICKDKLCQILSRREKKFTVVTTNIKPEAWPEKFDARIEDRLLRNSMIVSLFGVESYAAQKRQIQSPATIPAHA